MSLLHSLPGVKLPSAGALAAACAVALLVLVALCYLIRRRPDALALLAVFAMPFRLPVSTEGRTVNVLIPLYLVVGAGILVRLLPRLARWRAARAGAASDGRASARAVSLKEDSRPLREDSRPLREDSRPLREDSRTPREDLRTLAFWRTPRGLQILLFASVALYALQASYSSDHTKAAENVLFFYIPFGLLFVMLLELRWSRELLLRCLGVLVTLAVLFAGVGFIEYARKSLFLNPKIVAANEYANYFRVNSVFFDPSVYGRFLALVMIAVATIVLWSTNRRHVLAGAAVLAWLLAGLITTFSQSSIAALLLGLAILGAWRWSVRGAVYMSVALAVLALAVLLAAPASLHFGLKGSVGSANNATNGRANLIEGGLELFAKRPLQGFGSGSFEHEYKLHSNTSGQNAVSASHTVPVTIAAEQGLIGFAVYLALILSAFAVLFRGAGRSPPRIAIAACFAALVLHTWAYADFLEDPFTWTLLAIGVALARPAVASGTFERAELLSGSVP